MSVINLLNQTITVYNRASYNSQGRDVMDVGNSIKARFQPMTKTRLLSNNSVLIIDAVAYVAPNVTVAIDDKVIHSSIAYKVIAKYPVPDGSGSTNHIKIELQKWQTT